MALEQNLRYKAMHGDLMNCLRSYYGETLTANTMESDPLIDAALEHSPLPVMAFSIAVDRFDELCHLNGAAFKVQYQFGGNESGCGYLLMNGFTFGKGLYAPYDGDPEDADAEDAHNTAEGEKTIARAARFAAMLIKIFTQFYHGSITDAQLEQYIALHEKQFKSRDLLLGLFEGYQFQLSATFDTDDDGWHLYLNNERML